MIFLKTEERFILVDHKLREIYPFETPIVRDQLLDAETRELRRVVFADWVLKIDSSQLISSEAIVTGWSASHFRVEISTSGGHFHETVDVWLTHELGLDTTFYWQFLLNSKELLPGREMMWKHLAALGGFPVRVDVDSREDGGRMTFSTTLESITEQESEPSAYDPPADYHVMPIDPKGRFLSRPGPISGSGH